MKTLSKYKATLTNKRSFSIEGISDRKIHVGTKSQFQKMYSGSSTEEVLYTTTWQRNLIREEIRNIFFDTFPKSWIYSFKKTHDVHKCTLQDIKEWMTTTKMEAERETSKRKKQTNDNDSNKKHKKNGKQGAGSKGSGSKECTIHRGHAWKDCKLREMGNSSICRTFYKIGF